MNTLQSSPPFGDNKTSYNSYNPGVGNSIDNDLQFSNELFANLKQNYEERFLLYFVFFIFLNV